MSAKPTLLAAALATALSAGEASATTLQQQLVGTWAFVASGAPGQPQFPDATTGVLVFTDDGRFAQILVVAGVARAASASRVRGPEDEKTMAKESVSLFGTYTVDDRTLTITYHVQASTIPNWHGTEQARPIELLTAEELRLGGPAGTWKRAGGPAKPATAQAGR
jgi:hypothetical protein